MNVQNVFIVKQVTSSFIGRYQSPFVVTFDLKYEKSIIVLILSTLVCSTVKTK